MELEDVLMVRLNVSFCVHSANRNCPASAVKDFAVYPSWSSFSMKYTRDSTTVKSSKTGYFFPIFPYCRVGKLVRRLARKRCECWGC